MPRQIAPASAARGRPAWLIPALACAALFAHALLFRFEIDDAYISFRYARQLLDGHGLVFNPGVPVEGYSNLLWVLLSAAGMAAGLPALLWARIMGFAAAAGTLLLLPGLVARLRGARGGGEIAVWLLSACGPVACWSLAGLETPLFGLLIALAWRAAVDGRAAAAGGYGVLLLLTRPEGLALGAVFAAWAAARRSAPPSWRRWSGLLLVVVAAGLHLAWRRATYGDWLPNTYFAKTGDLAGQLRTGLPYAGAFLLAFVLPWVFVLGALAMRGRGAGRLAPTIGHSRALQGTLALLAGWTVYAAVVGGDMLGMYRFFAPVLPLVIACGAALLTDLLPVRPGAARSAGGTAWALVALLFATTLLPSFVGKERRLITAHMSQANLGGWRLAAEGLATQLPAGTTIALSPVGYIPYRTGFVTYDILGITDRHIAHRAMKFTQGYAGHEKHDGAYILGKRPDLLLLGNVDVTDRPRREPMRPFARELDIFQHPIFHQDYVPVFYALPGGKYLNCFQRRDLIK